ncbi:MAG: hypothetical protein EOM21_20220, partial [Gammaproteobacteria bacterium]|nr:hypothetical protein [Gammaproteobacteria bacterium]
MALASDEDGFLKGRPLDLGRTLELWRELRSDLAHIKEMLRKGMASSEPDAPRESPAPAQQPLERTSPVVVQPIGKAADRGLAQALEAVAAIAARAMPESAMPSMPSGKVPVDMPARPIGAGGTPKSDARAPAPDPKTAPLLEKIKRGIESQEATIEKGLIALRKAIEDLIDATRWAKKDDSGGGLLDKLPGLLGKG